jgi:mannose-1-phosphate guanylyltransferase/mannose-6-phosphate isomerase
MKLHPVILSGGSGTRLWPLSRSAVPKQFLSLASDLSLLQETALRAKIAAESAPIIVCNHEHRFLVAEQLRKADVKPHSIVLEPCARNTAPAVAIAALAVVSDDPEALLLVLPSDHVIRDVEGFAKAVKIAADAAATGALVTFGIKPTRAETGYGYIRRGRAMSDSGCYEVGSFVEKPNAENAAKYYSSEDYYWNSGMFVFSAAGYLAELSRLRPDMYAACVAALERGERDLDFLRLDQKSFESCVSDSIDYAVMEHTTKAAVVPVDIGWSDVGSWDALWDIADKDADRNVTRGDVYIQDASNNYVTAQSRFIAAIGVEDLVIIETSDAVLIASKSKVQQVNKVVAHLKAAGRQEHINHAKVYRPWGSYESLDEGSRFQVKRIIVKPGEKLSLQRHHHRAEHWVVVCGTAQVTRGDEVLLLTENQSTYIPLGTAHRLENPGKVLLEIIEVQSGGYLGEDDIVRLDDVYGRQ